MKLSCVIVAGLLMVSAALAQYVDAQNVLIRNVQLIDRDDDDAKVIVNILIRDNKVEVVTKDEIPIGEVSMAIDGRNGFLLGALVIGEAPKFIILDQDARENFDVLVNSGPHVLFAVNDGELVKNMLFEIRSADGTASETPKNRGWMAYTPPPMALATSYLDDSKWNKWTSKYIDGLFVAAVVLDRQHWISQNDDNRQAKGADFHGADHVDGAIANAGAYIRIRRLAAITQCRCRVQRPGAGPAYDLGGRCVQ